MNFVSFCCCSDSEIVNDRSRFNFEVFLTVDCVQNNSSIA